MTWPGSTRRFDPAPCTLLLVLALLAGPAASQAHAAVVANILGTDLRVSGDAANDDINLRLSADTLRVEVRNDGALVNSFLRTAFTTITIDGGAGFDDVLIDETNGAFTHVHPTTILGGDGNDSIVGGAGAETIAGGPGIDDIRGGRGSDVIHGGAGDDMFFWDANSPLLPTTDGADTIDGDEGNDMLWIAGNASVEHYWLDPAGGRALLRRDSQVLSPVQLDIGTIESLFVQLGGGNNQFITAPGFTTSMTMIIIGGDGDDWIQGGPGDDVIDGTAGNDTLGGGDGDDEIDGRDGDDTIRGNGGDDTIDGGPGDDTMYGNEGDDDFPSLPPGGNDTIEGGPGTDTVRRGGTSNADTFVLQPNGQGIRLVRNPAPTEAVDLLGVERLRVDMAAGNDTFSVQSGLANPPSLTILGSLGNDVIFGGPVDDTLFGGEGDDVISGGGGNDTISGFSGTDTLYGDAGNDTIIGGEGNDAIHGGAGDDVVNWSALDSYDVVDGDAGTDTFSVESDTGNDNVVLWPNGSRVRLEHGPIFNSPNSVLDLGTMERVDVVTGSGTDWLTLSPGLGALLERVTANMGEHSDRISTVASATPLVLDGGDAPDDRLFFDALNQSVHLQPSTIASDGVVRVTHVNVEQVTITNQAGALPAVTITAPTSDPAMTSTSPFVTVAGTVADDGQIVSVTWSSDRGGNGTATGTTAWTAADVRLQPGINTITVSALDSTGNMAYDTIAVDASTLTYSLAEGATGSFFDLDVLIANPSTTPAPATVTFLSQGGAPIVHNLTLPATSRTTIHVDDVPGLENQGGVSTVVTATTGVPLVVERTMFWDASYYGSHGGTAVDGPRTRWLFAEGSEGFFNTFVLLANSGASASTVTLTFLREGSTPFTRVVTVPPAARVTVAANGIPELVGQAFSIVVDATTPILAERAMYFGTARLFDGGHESAGVPEGATSWFLAEGATGPFFETFVLVGNPNPVAANVTFTFLTDDGVSVTRQKGVPANGRLTVNLEAESPALANAAVSTTIASDQPVIAERAMYWPGPPSTWAEAHNSFGATALSPKWGLAEGRVGMDHAFQTYILLANPSTTAANVQITFLRANGTTVVKTFTVAPTSRFNVAVNTAAPELQNEAFGALIEVTNGVGISVERAMYSDALGQTWAAGTNALATRLP